MMARLLLLPFVLAGLAAAACSARLRSAEVTGAARGERVDGIPFRLRESYRVHVYQRTGTAPATTYKQVFQKIETLPDMDHVYVLGVDADGLSDHTLQLTIRDDGTLQGVDLRNTDLKADELLTNLGASVKEISTAVADAEKNRLAKLEADDLARTSLDDARRSTLSEQLQREREAYAEQDNVKGAEEELARIRTLPGTDSAAIAVQERKIAAGKRLANDKARLAGLAIPYP